MRQEPARGYAIIAALGEIFGQIEILPKEKPVQFALHA
jgi:hypothetical protein